MCGNYRFVNKWTWFNKYAMPFITRGFLILLAKPRCLTFWIYNPNITNCHFKRVQGDNCILGHWPKWEGLCMSGSSYLLGWRIHLQNSKRWCIKSLQAWIFPWWHCCVWFHHGKIWSSFEDVFEHLGAYGLKLCLRKCRFF